MQIKQLIFFSLLLSFTAVAQGKQTDESRKAERELRVSLGKALFEDTGLSNPPGQSCATCHSPKAAFADPAKLANSVGTSGKFGPRNTPSILYANAIPIFGYSEEKQAWLGGQFWDGRVDTLAEQAIGPLLNPVEMNSTGERVLQRIKHADYSATFKTLYGNAALASPDAALRAVADALQAFQENEAFGPRYTSKYDAWQAQKVAFTELEARGNFVFQDSGLCLNCHRAFNDGDPVMFTDWTFHNIGVPRNPEAPFLTSDPNNKNYIDPGLGAHPKLTEQQKASAKGQFRTPSLRNVELTAPYMHNGVFTTLREVVEFYNTRDVSDRWGPPEVNENVNTEDMGNLKLSERDIDALVAFMKTLTDGYIIPEDTPTASDKVRTDK